MVMVLVSVQKLLQCTRPTLAGKYIVMRVVIARMSCIHVDRAFADKLQLRASTNPNSLLVLPGPSKARHTVGMQS
jgi:hypothetical protein